MAHYDSIPCSRQFPQIQQNTIQWVQNVCYKQKKDQEINAIFNENGNIQILIQLLTFEMENIQNMQPNCPELSQLIRENLHQQRQQSIKQTLFKESLMKISLQKDFRSIFNHDHSSFQVQEAPQLLQVPEQIKSICSWLQENNGFIGAAYLKTHLQPKMMHILHQKIENVAIVVTQYQSWWMDKMEQLDRLSTLKWGFLNATMTSEDKVKVLELYQLKKIKLLFISPSLFKAQKYHQFQSDLLIMLDLHLYTKNQATEQFLNTIIEKTSPGRVLGLHSTLVHQSYISLNKSIEKINNPDHSKFNFLALKTPSYQKCKTIVSYINRNGYKNVLVLGNKKTQLNQLNRKLQMESLSVYNIMDCGLALSDLHAFSAVESISRSDKKQQKILDAVRKSNQFNITLSVYFDALRFADFEAVIFYSFLEVGKFVDYCPQTKNKLMLIVDDDYYTLRNNITSDFVPIDHLQRMAMKVMEKPKKREESNSFKRCYSQHVNDKLLECFSTNKEKQPEHHSEKVIKISNFCKNFDISAKIFSRMIDVLQSNEIIENMCRIPYEIQIQDQSLQKFRQMHPNQQRRKINLLSLSTCLKKTTCELLSELNCKDLKYKVVEQTIQIMLNKDYDEVNWLDIWKQQNQAVQTAACHIDKSYDMFKECAYASMELTRREKFLNRKDKFVEFVTAGLQGEQNNSILQTANPSVLNTNVLESSHRSNLLTAQIQEWLRNSEEKLEEHDLILMLQGVDKAKFIHLKKDPVFGRYKRFKYEEMSQAVQKITKNKRIKL